MKHFTFIFLLIICSSCHQKKEIIDDNVIIDRIEYLYKLKSLISQNLWQGFNNKEFDLPLIYYTDSMCYITNPTERFINKFNPTFIFENQNIKIYKANRIDSTLFHMHVSVSFDSTEYNYRLPLMLCSNTEITNKLIPDVPSTEVWATMIIHEYFHGFQFRHTKFLDFFEQNIGVSADTLKNIYSKNKWFRESVDKENEMLLSALASKDRIETSTLINTFFEIRKERRNKTKEKLGFKIKPIEEIYETMEGTARYVEYSLYELLPTLKPDTKLLYSDTLYHSNSYFKDFSFDNAKWLYKTGYTTYYYAIGFNMLRLMDKLEIDYKSSLFEEKVSLEQIMRDNTMKNTP